PPTLPTDPPILTPETAERVLKLDAARILEKVRKKEALTRAERAYVLSIRGGGKESGQTTAANYEELADLLGVTARGLRDWRKLDGAPRAEADGGHDVGAWRAFVKARGLKDNTADDCGEGEE